MKILIVKVWGIEVREWLVLLIFALAMASCDPYVAPMQDIKSDLQGNWNVDKVVLIDETETMFGFEEQPGIYFNFNGSKMCKDSLSILNCHNFEVMPGNDVLMMKDSGRKIEVYNLNENTCELAGPYSPSGLQRIIYYLRKIN